MTSHSDSRGTIRKIANVYVDNRPGIGPHFNEYLATVITGVNMSGELARTFLETVYKCYYSVLEAEAVYKSPVLLDRIVEKQVDLSMDRINTLKRVDYRIMPYKDD